MTFVHRHKLNNGRHVQSAWCDRDTGTSTSLHCAFRKRAPVELSYTVGSTVWTKMRLELRSEGMTLITSRFSSLMCSDTVRGALLEDGQDDASSMRVVESLCVARMEPCRFDDGCWHPLCPFRHSGIDRAAGCTFWRTWRMNVLSVSLVSTLLDSTFLVTPFCQVHLFCFLLSLHHPQMDLQKHSVTQLGSWNILERKKQPRDKNK